MKKSIILLLFAGIILNLSAGESDMKKFQKNEIATFAGGCFWCTEAIFEEVKGVISVKSGYSGGNVVNPSYREVSMGTTGHAEAVQIEFDPNMISYIELLEIFFKMHDPTTLNRQGADVGTQYRSAIFYHNEEQKRIAEKVIDELNNAGLWSKPIVTEVTKYKNFFEAEDYHQEYFTNNPQQPYCRIVIQPKMEKFRKVFQDKVK